MSASTTDSVRRVRRHWRRDAFLHDARRRAYDDQRVDASGAEIGVEIDPVEAAVAVLVQDDVAVVRLDGQPAASAGGAADLSTTRVLRTRLAWSLAERRFDITG